MRKIQLIPNVMSNEQLNEATVKFLETLSIDNAIRLNWQLNEAQYLHLHEKFTGAAFSAVDAAIDTILKDYRKQLNAKVDTLVRSYEKKIDRLQRKINSLEANKENK